MGCEPGHMSPRGLHQTLVKATSSSQPHADSKGFQTFYRSTKQAWNPEALTGSHTDTLSRACAPAVSLSCPLTYLDTGTCAPHTHTYTVNKEKGGLRKDMERKGWD